MTAPLAEDGPSDDEKTPAHRHPTFLELRSGQCRFPIGGYRGPEFPEMGNGRAAYLGDFTHCGPSQLRISRTRRRG